MTHMTANTKLPVYDYLQSEVQPSPSEAPLTMPDNQRTMLYHHIQQA